MYHGYVPGINCCYFYCYRTVKSNFWIRSTKSTNRVESLDCLSRDRSGINQPQISLVSTLREAFQIRVEGTSRISASSSIMTNPLSLYWEFSIMWIQVNNRFIAVMSKQGSTIRLYFYLDLWIIAANYSNFKLVETYVIPGNPS